jgi:hypothetical protein
MRATHSYIIEKLDNTDCPFCNTTVEHMDMNMQRNWTRQNKDENNQRRRKKGREGMLKLVEYPYSIDFTIKFPKAYDI